MEWATGATSRRQFERFVAEATPGLLRTAYLITWDLAEAEDVVQEVWLATAQRWPTIRSMDFPRAYVRRSLVNLAVRRASRGVTASQDAADAEAVEDPRASGQMAMIDTRSEIIWLLGTLNRDQRAVIVLRYFEDMSESEIADQLGWPVGTVKSNAARAMQRLRRLAGTSTALDVTAPNSHRLTS